MIGFLAPAILLVAACAWFRWAARRERRDSARRTVHAEAHRMARLP